MEETSIRNDNLFTDDDLIPRGLKWPRIFGSKHPYEEIIWEIRTAKIIKGDGTIVFEQKNVEVPNFWSQTATDIVASKYFRGQLGAEDREYSAKQMMDRVAKTIGYWGLKDGYFASAEDCENFILDLTWILVNQYAAFNSPVWFNVGVHERPQCSACFILAVEDNMQSILDWYRDEGWIFKYGSGAGTNLSKLRSSKEPLSKGGYSSGPVSFMKGADGVANSIRSGGTTRRAAKMVIMNADHPDIKNFIYCKKIIEDMTKALIRSGIRDSITADIFDPYTLLPYQNANNSVRVNDAFMRAVQADGYWNLMGITTGEAIETIKARELMDWVADAAWHSADPGMQYDTTINEWHTCPNTGRINASNPCCVTGDTLIAVADGRNAVPIKDLVGFEAPVYSHSHRTGKTTVARMWNIGVKRQHTPIYEVLLDDSTTFRATDDHLIMLRDGSYRMVCDLKDGDSLMPFHSKILAPAKTRTKRRYYWTGDFWQPQYRAVWRYFNGEQPIGTHVHHQDFNACNDLFDNLILLSIEEHQKIHRDSMLGDNNPARRLMNDTWRANIAEAVRGEKNGNFGNIHSEETRTKMRQRAALRWLKPEEHRRLSISAAKWQTEAKAEGRRVGGIPGERFERCCPICRENYLTTRPEQIFCSLICRYSLVGLQMSGAKTASSNRGRHLSDSHRARLSMALKIVSDPETKRRAAKVAHRNHILRAARLLLDNNITPAIDDWDILARQARELGAKRVPSSGIVKQYFSINKKFVEAATLNNHKVVSVTFVGYEDVYDGTVDEHHNFAILTATTDSCVKGAKNYSGIFIHNSEYMHLDNSACNLASLNLLKFLKMGGKFDVELFRKAVDTMITAQDIIVDNASYPTAKIEENARNYRQLGLGYANLGATLMVLGLPYDSEKGRTLAGQITSLMCGEAYRMSAMLSDIKGPFAGYELNKEPMLGIIAKHLGESEKLFETSEMTGIEDEDLHMASRLIWHDALDLGRKYGIRNSQATVLAPTGTIAFLMDCDTTGIEPELALVKYKKLVGGGTLKLVNNHIPLALRRLGYSNEQIEDISGYLLDRETIEGAPHLKEEHVPVFDCSFKAQNGQRSIQYRGHIKMMSVAQPFISGAISKTVNLPAEATVDDIKNVFMEGWRLGLKAIAIYRDGSKSIQPLNTKKEENNALIEKVNGYTRIKLPDERPSITHKFNVGGFESYLTVGFYPDTMKPGETFLIAAKEGSTISGLFNTIATLISMCLQSGIPLKTLVRKFKDVRFDPAGFTNNPEIPTAKSITDYVFRYLGMKYLKPEDKEELFGLEHANAPEIEVKAPVAESKTDSLLAELVSKPIVPAQISGNGKAPGVITLIMDAPPCVQCGTLMVRAGSCYSCPNCFATTGVCN